MSKFVLITPEELQELISASLKKELQLILNSFTDNHSSDKEEYMTRQEAAKFLRCSLTTLYYYEQKNKLTPLRIGRKILYPKSNLIAAMKDNISILRGP
jgi:excisionase family DNA binding protein